MVRNKEVKSSRCKLAVVELLEEEPLGPHGDIMTGPREPDHDVGYNSRWTLLTSIIFIHTVCARGQGRVLHGVFDVNICPIHRVQDLPYVDCLHAAEISPRQASATEWPAPWCAGRYPFSFCDPVLFQESHSAPYPGIQSVFDALGVPALSG